MTLPSTGQIGMSQVRTELGLSGQVSLNQSQVRTLAGIASGQIDLNALHGKSATTAYRPSTYTLTSNIGPGGITNPTYAYDGSSSTYAVIQSNQTQYTGGNIAVVFSGFPSVVYTGTLKIINTWSLSSDTIDSDASATVEVSIDGGSTWTTLATYDANNWGGTDTGSFSINYAVSGLNLSNLRVRLSAGSFFCLPAGAIFNIFDIVVS